MDRTVVDPSLECMLGANSCMRPSSDRRLGVEEDVGLDLGPVEGSRLDLDLVGDNHLAAEVGRRDNLVDPVARKRSQQKLRWKAQN